LSGRYPFFNDVAVFSSWCASLDFNRGNTLFTTTAPSLFEALEEPIKQSAINEGVDGSVVVNNRCFREESQLRYDASKDEYCDVVKKALSTRQRSLAPRSKTRPSIASTLLTRVRRCGYSSAPAPVAPQGGDMGGMY